MKSLDMQRIVSDALSVSAFLPFLMLGSPSFAQPPPNYYIDADLTSGTALRASIHEIIDDHKRLPYTSNLTDTWDVLNRADQDPSNSLHVVTIYKDASYQKIEGGRGSYNREHLWPKSYGFLRTLRGIILTRTCIISSLLTHHTTRREVTFPSERVPAGVRAKACFLRTKDRQVRLKVEARQIGDLALVPRVFGRFGTDVKAMWHGLCFIWPFAMKVVSTL